MKRLCGGEKGAVTIIEAAFVFPIVFCVVFFMIMTAEAYYQSARVEYAVTTAAIDGAARCENPMLRAVISAKSVPTVPTTVDVLPYRYIFTGDARQIADEVKSDLKNKIEGFKPLLFKNMYPHNVEVDVDLHMNVLVSSLPVTCAFDVPFPIRMIFTGESYDFSYSVKTTATIGDPTEFVRNVAMIADLIERSEKASEVVGGFVDKMKTGLEKVGKYIN